MNTNELKLVLKQVESIGHRLHKTKEQILFDQVLTAAYILMKQGHASITLDALREKAGFSAMEIYIVMEEAAAQEMIMNISRFICMQDWILRPKAVEHIEALLQSKQK